MRFWITFDADGVVVVEQSGDDALDESDTEITQTGRVERHRDLRRMLRLGGRGWSGEPAWLTVDSIDAADAIITIEGTYPDVDGTWDVPLCGGVGPA